MVNELDEIYNNLLIGYSNIEKYIKTIKSEHVNLLDLKFDKDMFPLLIQNWVKRNIREKICYILEINKKTIVVNFYKNNDYQIKSFDISKIVLIIYLLTHYSKNSCSKNIEIDIYFTPFKKELSEESNVLDVINVNTGYSTSGCINKSSIVIYRHEEWYKVLIHELFHNLDLDFSSMEMSSVRENMKNIFGIESEYNIYETYCEAWARILNIYIIGFLENKDKEDKNKFYINFELNIERERIFSLIQANRIIKIISESKNYNEKTNILCYYVYTAALLNDYKDFIDWCLKNNENIFRFKKNKKNIKLFMNLIIEKFNSESFINELSKLLYNEIGNTLKMTVIN